MIIAFTPIWGRHKILNIWLEGIRRLRQSFDIEPFAMVSTDEDAEWCNDNNVEFVFTDNQPLGRKQNVGLQALEGREFDYICQISSDLLLTDEGMAEMLARNGDVIGFHKAYFVDTVDKVAVVFASGKSHRCLGACRMIHRSVIERCWWELWDDEWSNCLDRSSEQRMGDVEYSVIEDPLVVGLKSDVQITSFDKLTPGRTILPMEEALERLSEREKQMIREL